MTSSSSRALLAPSHANGAHTEPGDAHARLRDAIVRFDAAARARVVAASVDVEALAVSVASRLQARASAALNTGVRDHAWLLLGAACLAGAILGHSPRRRRRTRS